MYKGHKFVNAQAQSKKGLGHTSKPLVPHPENKTEKCVSIPFSSAAVRAERIHNLAEEIGSVQEEPSRIITGPSIPSRGFLNRRGQSVQWYKG